MEQGKQANGSPCPLSTALPITHFSYRETRIIFVLLKIQQSRVWQFVQFRVERHFLGG
jgi:hypothetical protein